MLKFILPVLLLGCSKPPQVGDCYQTEHFVFKVTESSRYGFIYDAVDNSSTKSTPFEGYITYKAFYQDNVVQIDCFVYNRKVK